MKSRQLAIALLATMIACPVTQLAAEPQNIVVTKNNLTHYHDSGHYERDLAKSAERIRRYVSRHARLNHFRLTPKKLALVLDVDETVLSNYDSLKSMNFGGNKKLFRAIDTNGKAKAIKPMRWLYEFTKAKGVEVFFISGRPESERKPTEQVLKREGFTGYKHLYLKPRRDHESSITPFKQAMRGQIVKHGYTIIATAGDQYSDSNGQFTGRRFKLPNPYYYIP